MPRSKSKQPAGISWKTVLGILGSIAVFVGSIVSGLDFINYLQEGYQQFLWLGIVVLGVLWLIVLWILFKQRNIYWMLYLMVTVLAGVVIWNGWHSYLQTREDKLVVLIAKFDGPEEVYGLRNEILEKLNQDFGNDSQVEIETINEVITPDSNSNSSRAKKLGENLQADIVIWGWYRPTEDPNITIHIENLEHVNTLAMEQSTTIEPVVTLSELQSFSFQQQAGQETSALLSYITGYVSYNAGDYDDAIKRFDRALTTSEGNGFLQRRANIHLYKLAALIFLHQYDQVIQSCTEIITLDSDYSGVYSNCGTAYMGLGNYEQAIQEYTKAIKLAPDSDATYANRGAAYSRLGKYDQAIQDYAKAIELNPEVVAAYYGRGNIYYYEGKYGQAIQEYGKAVDLDPNFVWSYYNRGAAYYQLEKYDQAIQEYSKAIDLDLTSSLAYNNRARVYYDSGNYNQTIRDGNQALELEPDSVAAYNNRGAAYYSLNEFDKAIQDFSKVLELDPNRADIYEIRGKACERIGKTAEAKADLKKYEELLGQKP